MLSTITATHLSLAEAYLQNTVSTRPSHDMSHALRVHHLALHLASHLPSTTPTPDIPLIRIAALLHDVFDHKLVHPSEKPDALLRQLLNDIQLTPDDANRVAFICNNLSFSKQRKAPIPEAIRTIELNLVQDADRLDAIGAIGIARCLAYTGEVGRSLSDARLHFDEKLVKLKDLMRTEPAKKIAEVRHQVLLDFMAAYDDECILAGQ